MIAFISRVLAGAFTALEFHALRFWRHWLTVWVIVALCVLSSYLLLKAPLDFDPVTITVEQGEPASAIAHELARARVVTNAYPLWLILRASHGDSNIRTGTYRFNSPENVFSVARRLLTADYGLPAVRLTFIEGVTVREIALQVSTALPGISAKRFVELARPHEGYLFPDTYILPASSDAAAIIATMRENFDTKVEALEDDIEASGHTLAEVVTMASIIEKEARTEESQRIVAGILWNRLAKDMPLQVDAVFGYIFNRDTYHPSLADLKVDSPYNTYRNKGLPPRPINNPGLATLEAVLNPTKTSYVYYLTGSDDQMHYATTYAGHQTNLEKYLK
jgi:UPF0755 protein